MSLTWAGHSSHPMDNRIRDCRQLHSRHCTSSFESWLSLSCSSVRAIHAKYECAFAWTDTCYTTWCATGHPSLLAVSKSLFLQQLAVIFQKLSTFWRSKMYGLMPHLITSCQSHGLSNRRRTPSCHKFESKVDLFILYKNHFLLLLLTCLAQIPAGDPDAFTVILERVEIHLHGLSTNF